MRTLISLGLLVLCWCLLGLWKLSPGSVPVLAALFGAVWFAIFAEREKP